MSWSLTGRSKWAVTSFSVMSIGVLLSFQNCGKAGFDDSAGGLNELTQNSLNADPSLSAAPFPFQTNVNLISYMSCPMAGQAGRRDPQDLLNPFYNLRAGAYDNLGYAASFGLGSLSAAEKSARLQAGVGLSKDFVNYVKGKYGRADKDVLLQALMSAPKGLNSVLNMALINEERSRVSGGFGWDYQLYAPMLANLSEPVMAGYLSKAGDNEAYGTQKQSFFSSMDATSRSLVTSLSWGQNEIDRDSFNSQIRSNLILTLGYMSLDGGGDITQLTSPDSDSYKSVYGRGYRLFWSNQANGLQSSKQHFMSDIEELNMEKKPLESVRSAEGQAWQCFSLRVVRHMDRINAATGYPYTSPGIYDYTKPGDGSIIRGVRVACPVQTISNLNTQVSENGVTYQKNMLRLQMARRVLPADLWEINTDPNYMCAVPTDTAMQKGSCYASGDQDQGKYIQYSLQQTLPNGTKKDCGPGGNECPVYVSICYRTR